MQKIKILHILHSLEVGGLENGVINLVNRLDPDRYEHAICCIASSGPMAERIERTIPIYELGKRERRKAYLLPLTLAKVIRQVAPDIVHTRNWGTIDAVIGARLAGVRYVVHGEHGREATDPTGANARRKIFRRLLSPFINRYLTVSHELRDWLIDEVGVSAKKVRQIINGVDAVRFRPTADQRTAKERLGIEAEELVFGIVGRLDPVKDHATLLKAVASQEKKCRLLVVGAGPLEDQLKQLAASLDLQDRVIFAGKRDNVVDFLQAMDVFILPSMTEGISNTILEAMACGLPVVASQVGGNPELVVDGETGYLFSPGDADGLAAILARYIADPGLVKDHGGKGRARVESELSLARMVNKYDELYSELVG